MDPDERLKFGDDRLALSDENGSRRRLTPRSQRHEDDREHGEGDP